MRRLNIKVLVAVVLVLGLAAGGAYGLRKYNLSRNAEVRLRQAEVAEQEGRPREAVELLGHYLALRPEDTEALARYGRLLDEVAAGPRDRLRAMLVMEQVLRRDRSRDDLRRRVVQIALSDEFRRYKEAGFHLEILLEEFPGDGELLTQLGQYHEAAERWADAARAYEEAIAQGPDRVDAYVRLARVSAAHLEGPGRADQVMAALVEANPGSAAAYLERARHHDRSGRAADARADLARARELGPEDADVLLESARLAEGPAEERAYLATGLEHHPKDDRMYRAMALVEVRDGRPEQAIERLRNGIEQLPESKELKYSLAELLVEADHPEDAQGLINDLEADEAVREDLVALLRARIAAGRAEWLEAAGLLAPVAATLEDMPEVARVAYALLGQCHLETGNVDQARHAYRRAVDLDPLWGPARIGLADTLARLGDLEESIRELRIVEARHPVASLSLARLVLVQALQTPTPQRRWDVVEAALDKAERAAEDGPQSIRVAILRATALAARGQEDRAREALEAARDAHPDRLEPRAALAALAQSRGDFDGAAAVLDQAEQQLGDSIDLRLARVRCRAEQGGPGAGGELAALAGDLDARPDADRARLLDALAVAHLRLGEADQAGQYLRRLAELRPDSLGARILLFDLALQADDDRGMQEHHDVIRRIEGQNGTWWRLTEASLRIARIRRGEAEPNDPANARRRLDELAAQRPDWARVALLKGELLDAEGEANQAIAAYQHAQELGDRQPRVARHLAELLSRRGRFEEADRAIRVLVESERELDDDLKRLAADVSLRADDPQRALDLARETVAPDSIDHREQVWMGQMLWATNRPAEAEAAFRKALDLAPSEPEPRVALALLLARTDRLDEARRVVRDAEASLPPERAPLALARCYEAVGQPEQAEAQYRRALEASPKDVEVLWAAVTFYQNAGRLQDAVPPLRALVDPETRAPELDAARGRRLLALILTTRNDPSVLPEAEELLNRNLSEGESLPEDRRLKAVVLTLLPGRATEAIELLEGLERDGPLPAGEQFLLARLYEAAGRWPDARGRMLGLLTSADQDDPQYAMYLTSYIEGLLKQGSTSEAQLWLSRLEKLGPGAEPAALLKPRLAQAQGRDDMAAALLLELVRANGDSPEKLEAASSAAVAALFRAGPEDGQLDDAGRDLEEALRRNPGSPSIQFDLANLRSFQGRLSEAEALYRKALEADADNASVLNNLAYVIASQGGRGEEALGVINRAIAELGDAPDLLDTRGFIHLSMGRGGPAVTDFERAIAGLEKAAVAASSRPALLFHLARAHLAAGDREKATEALEQARGLGLDPKELHPRERADLQALSERLASR